LPEHDFSCQVSIDVGSSDNIHVLIVQYGLRVEIKESQKNKCSLQAEPKILNVKPVGNLRKVTTGLSMVNRRT